jgi:hypothetical protein
MKEPDPPEAFDQMILESFNELYAEAQVTPIDLEFPPAVMESLEAYTKKHSLDPAELIPLAMKARIDPAGSRWVEEVCRLMQDPDSFNWPLEDPLRCVAIAFTRKLTDRVTDKAREKRGLTDDEQDEADWGEPWSAYRES